MDEVKEWHIDRRAGVSKEIRPMTDEERQRAKEKEQANESSSKQKQ